MNEVGPEERDVPMAAECGLSEELVRLLDATVARLSRSRRTFTEPEALAEIWNAMYEVSPQIDPRFVLAREADGKHPRHWRLATQTLANNLLLDALTSGAWDGRDLDTELARLSEADGVHYVFCPVDPRFTERPDGRWEPAGREPDVALPPATRAELDTLGPLLTEQWRAAGATPWTAHQIMDKLAGLGWSQADKRGSWTLVRAWLHQWPAVVRVGQDYWTLKEHLPQAPAQTRLRVMPVISKPEPPDTSGGSTPPENGANRDLSAPSRDHVPSTRDAVIAPLENQSTGITASWTVALRTVNLVEGFLPVPAAARGAYPPRTIGMNRWEAVRGKWFETNDDLWIWLDRESDRLCGPDLADKLSWCDAGQQVRVEWAHDILILRLLGVDADVQQEETRLVDVEVLAALRGGLGESYRRSVHAILGNAPGGLTFPELVEAVRVRQGHTVHQGTIRAVLSTGGFTKRNGRWFAAPDPSRGARTLRRAVAQALVHPQPAEHGRPESARPPDLPTTVRAIHSRLHDLINVLHSNSQCDEHDD